MQHLVVDLGSSNGKIYLAGIREDRTLEMEEVDRFEMGRSMFQGHLSTDVFSVYGRICENLRRLTARGVQIDTVGIDSWSSDYSLIDLDSGMIGMPVFYRDLRTDGMEEEVEQTLDYREIYRLTTQRRLESSSLCQLLAYKKEYPHGLQGNKKILFLGDLLMYLLTGNLCSEVSVASYSQLFCMEKEDWEDEMFVRFQIPKSICPPVVRAGTVLGNVQENLSKFLGIGEVKVITPAVHDTSSAAVAVPALKGERYVFLATGSWFLMSMELEETADLLKSYEYGLSNTGLAFGKVLLKKNITAMWLVQECRRQWEQMGISYTYEELAHMAGEAEEFYGMLDTEDESFGRPTEMASAVCHYLERTGQRVPGVTDAGQIVRIIYESIVMQSRRALWMLEDTTGTKAEVLYVVGGASKVALLNQFLADATGLPVKTGPAEASAVGNALLQAYGTGIVESEQEMREIVRNSFPSEVYDPKDRKQWDRQYKKYLQLCIHKS